MSIVLFRSLLWKMIDIILIKRLYQLARYLFVKFSVYLSRFFQLRLFHDLVISPCLLPSFVDLVELVPVGFVNLLVPFSHQSGEHHLHRYRISRFS